MGNQPRSWRENHYQYPPSLLNITTALRNQNSTSTLLDEWSQRNLNKFLSLYQAHFIIFIYHLPQLMSIAKFLQNSIGELFPLQSFSSHPQVRAKPFCSGLTKVENSTPNLQLGDLSLLQFLIGSGDLSLQPNLLGDLSLQYFSQSARETSRSGH